MVRTIQRPQGGVRPVTDIQSAYPRLFPKDIPKVVLVNGYSASASEVFAGAMRVHKTMKVFGTKTFGKGSVQQIFPVEGGGGVKTTVAIYLAGGTMEIDGKGIEPDSPIQQPAIGASDADKAYNAHFIRISMDPTIDHQLNVARTYIMFFAGGQAAMFGANAGNREQAAMNASHGAKTKITPKLCKEKGLRGCPSSSTPGFMGMGRP